MCLSMFLNVLLPHIKVVKNRKQSLDPQVAVRKTIRKMGHLLKAKARYQDTSGACFRKWV